MNRTNFNDTILWSEESDNYTRRAFEGEDDPYNNTDRKSSIEIISKLFEVNSFKPKSILHIGCSAGFSFSLYQEYFQNAKLYGIDPGKESIQIAKDKFSEGGGAEFSVGYAHDLPYPDESMDVVFLPMVLQWVPRKKLMNSISEIDRVSKGFLILSEFLPDFPSWSYSKHNEMVKIFKQDYKAIFNSLPWWRTIKDEVFNTTESTDFQRSVTILKKLAYSRSYTHRDSVSEKQNPTKWKKI